MTLSQKITLAGVAWGTGAAVFSLGQAVAGGISPEAAVPGLLALVFSAVGAWGSSLISSNKSKSLRMLLACALGGLVSVDILYVPAAILVAAAALMVWRTDK